MRNKIITEEKRKKSLLERELEECRKEVERAGTPTYFFNIGDKVSIGNFLDVTISEKIGNAIYKINYSVKHTNYGKPYIESGYSRYVTWFEIRPFSTTEKSIVSNNDIKLNFSTTTIEGMLNKYYHFGIDMCPEYQRDFVWTEKDREALLDSVFSNIEIGKFVLVKIFNDNNYYEVLDGKQRLKTIVDFFENRFSYKGKFYNDLSWYDRNHFKNYSITTAQIEKIDYKDILRYFVVLNKAGRAMDYKHLEKIENLLKNTD